MCPVRCVTYVSGRSKSDSKNFKGIRALSHLRRQTRRTTLPCAARLLRHGLAVDVHRVRMSAWRMSSCCTFIGAPFHRAASGRCGGTCASRCVLYRNECPRE